MASDWLSSAISGAAGLLGSAVNYFGQQSANETNLQLARENRDFYFEQWERERDFYLEQWHRENAYNDPSSVMQRLAGAGLNPNLMYGSGAGGLAASATMQNTSMQNTDPGRVVAPQVDPMMMAQIGLLSAQTNKTEAETEKVASDIRVNDGIVKLNESTVLLNSAMISFTKAQQDKVVAEMGLIADQQREIQSRIDLNLASVERMSEQTAVDWYNAFIADKTADAQIDKLASEKGWIDEQKKYYKAYIFSVISDNKASAELKKAEAGLTEKQKEQVVETTKGIKYSNGRLKIQLDLDNAGYAKTERELEQLRVAASVFEAAASSMDEVSGVRNVPRDVKSAATNAANRAANRVHSRRGQ